MYCLLCAFFFIFLFFFCICFFFFQAEDGIRDLVRSRGLGDVYKRQLVHCVKRKRKVAERVEVRLFEGQRTVLGEVEARPPVSYTHLTLPTSDLV